MKNCTINLRQLYMYILGVSERQDAPENIKPVEQTPIVHSYQETYKYTDICGLYE